MLIYDIYIYTSNYFVFRVGASNLYLDGFHKPNKHHWENITLFHVLSCGIRVLKTGHGYGWLPLHGYPKMTCSSYGYCYHWLLMVTKQSHPVRSPVRSSASSCINSLRMVHGRHSTAPLCHGGSASLEQGRDGTPRDATDWWRTDDSIDSLCQHFLGVGHGEKQGDIRVCGTMAGYVDQWTIMEYPQNSNGVS